MRYLADNRVPNLSGCVCTAFFIEASLFHGRLQNASHAYYLQINENRWHRFRVDCTGARWKSVDSPDHPTLKDWEFQLISVDDLGIIGRRIQKIDYLEREPYSEEPCADVADSPQFDESVIRIHFAGNLRVEIWYRCHDSELNLVRTTSNRRRSKKTIRQIL